MKSLFLLFSFIALASYAQEPHVEFDQDHEVKCHQELKKIGCLNAKQEQVSSCVESQLSQLSSSCQKLHHDKKKWKSSLSGAPAPEQQ